MVLEKVYEERTSVTETELLRLTVKICEASTEPELWPGFLKVYAGAIGADIALFQVHDFASRHSKISAVFGLNSPLKQSYNDYYSKLNVWREHCRRAYKSGAVVLADEHCPREILTRSEFYNDCLLKLDGVYSLASVIAMEGQRGHALTSLRGRHQEPFGQPERQVAGLLLPHLQRAHGLQHRLQLLKAGEAVLDTLPVGVVFLDAGGHVVHANRAAEEILQAGDGILLGAGLLCACDSNAQAALRQAIQHAISPGRSLDCSAAVLVPRRSLRRPYQMTISALLSTWPQFAGTPAPAAVAIITDPDRQRPPNPELLRRFYGLTPKEATVAAKVAAGKTLREVAEELEMRYETARTHLRRIFDKTNTRRQAELAMLAARITS